jgi:type I restriction enzyme R subunit
VAFVRAYGGIADELEEAGYSATDVTRIKAQLDHYVNVREIVRRASGESLDLKPYEADMRHLLDTYIEAKEPRKISPFDGIGLLELIVKTGIADAIAAQMGGMKGNRDAIAETIENNVRSKIIKEHLNDPAFYDKMSTLLDEIIANRKRKALNYEQYLKEVADLVRRVEAGQADDTPKALTTPGRRALYNSLKAFAERDAAHAAANAEDVANRALDLALKLDDEIKTHRPDGWRGVHAKEQTIKAAMFNVLNDEDQVERLFPIVKHQREY